MQHIFQVEFPCSLCTYLSVIDQFLGCSLGPSVSSIMISVVHHALLQDHPGVLHEQCTSSSDHSHPGDIYILP